MVEEVIHEFVAFEKDFWLVFNEHQDFIKSFVGLS